MLPQEIERLEGQIARDEQTLADPDLFTRDPKRFDALMQAIATARDDQGGVGAALAGSLPRWPKARAEHPGYPPSELGSGSRRAASILQAPRIWILTFVRMTGVVDPFP